MSSSRKKRPPSNSAPSKGLAPQSQASQQLQLPNKSQSQSHSQPSQQSLQSQPLYPWSTHSPLSGQWSSPFPRRFHTLSMTATAPSELFLFGGITHGCKSNDLYVISTRDFSATPLQTSGHVPKPRFAAGAVLTGTTLLIWSGRERSGVHDKSFHLLDLGTSNLLMSRPAPADQSFLHSSIARVDPHHGQWSRARCSLLSYHDAGRFQTLRLWWPN